MPPRLLIVNEPPLISAGLSLPAFVFSANCASSTDNCTMLLLVDVADDRHDQPAVRVDRHADVHVLLQHDRLAGHVHGAVELRELLERARR